MDRDFNDVWAGLACIVMTVLIALVSIWASR